MAELFIRLDDISHNYKVAASLCRERGIELAVVVKSCAGNPVILEALIDSGMVLAADTHPENLTSIVGVKSISLLNPPSVIHRHQICHEMYMSSWPVLQEASRVKLYNNTRIVVAVDMGDHRDGVPAADLEQYLAQILTLPNLNIAGLSANWGCMMMSCPESEKLEDFGRLVENISSRLDWVPEVVSVGGSSIIHYVLANELPPVVNRLRLGEAIFMGFNPSLKQPVPLMKEHVCTLYAEVVEVLEGGHPQGVGWADMCVPAEDGVSSRAILDVGYSSIDPDGLTCCDDTVRVMRCSQDHLIVGSDIRHFAPGDTLGFYLDYHAFSRAMASLWIRKKYLSSTPVTDVA